MGRIIEAAASENIPWRALVRAAPDLQKPTAQALFTPPAERSTLDRAFIGAAQEVVDVRALEADERRRTRQQNVNMARGSRVNGRYLAGGQPRGRRGRWG